MRKMRFIIVLTILTCLHSALFSQNVKENTLKWNVDIANRHVWRGGLTVNGACLKPSIEYNTKGLTLGAWSVYSLNDDYQEVDLYVGYTLGKFNLTLYDFYCPSNDDKEGDLFDYDNKSKVHKFDLVAQYTISEDIPINLLAACYVHGDINNKGDERYSTYFEASYPCKIAGKNVRFTTGAAPGYSCYIKEGNHFNIINLGMGISDEIKINNTYSLPVSANLTLNPHTERMYLTVAFSLGN